MFPISRLCSVLVLLLAFTPGTHAGDSTVHFSVYEYPPLYHTAESGRFSGTLGETILQICEQEALECKPQMMPIARAYEQVINAESDMTISATHPRFDECCNATDWSYPWSAGLFSRSAEEIPLTEEEMKGRSMVVVRGWRSQYRFMPNFDQLVADNEIRVFYANSNYSAIKMLQSGRAELLWGSVDYLWYLDKLNLSDQFHYAERLQIPIVLWVNKQRPDLLDKLNQGFETLQQAGQFDQQNLLRPELLHPLYQDAPLKKGQ